uniref:Reverse transcriptase Ty1/copia-type domain-containing protein n=1 Tax=Steinernema glaseri TaxID=37863 RepID=A0A1I8AFB2_9BILA
MARNSTKVILDKTNETIFFWIDDILFTGIMAGITIKLVESKEMFEFHCDQQDDVGRKAFNRLDHAGYSLRNTSCDQNRVPAWSAVTG